uniref:Malectin domain-containing protein n=1 Tax=Syphacia muris TaxID=451379 RepID=A0A0N5ASL5_9BILA
MTIFKRVLYVIRNRLGVKIGLGGKAHIDSNGIKYQADYLEDGIASDYGTRYEIARVDSKDAILYQTERYSLDDFSYDIPLPSKNGIYTLVLKFCEVYFRSAGKKACSCYVFDVLLNDGVIISDLDIWKMAGGTGVAYDQLVTFELKGNEVYIGENIIEVSGGLKLTFAKGLHDNPKINAFYLYRGSKQEIPPLLNLAEFLNKDDVEEEEKIVDLDSKETPRKVRLDDEPLAEDPYEKQDSAYIIFSFLVLVVCFFPILYCLCKM